MTSILRGGILRVCTRLGVFLSCLLAFSAVASAQVISTGNVVKSIRAVESSAVAGSGPEVEIEVYSPTEFPVRDQVVILRIGRKDVLKSRTPADGSLNTLIFSVPASEFEQIADGESMTVQYGRNASPRQRWNFGKLNKSLLVR